MLIGGRYETIRELGRGGLGKTYLAEDTYRRGSPKCVVKRLQPASKLPTILHKARAIFEAEAEALHVLGKYDQIPKLYEHLEQNGEFYTVQELIDGHDLRQSFLLGDRWEEKTLVNQLREILEILDLVHEKQVVHQDIKPQNLIRRWKDKKLVLIDFGGIKTIRHLAPNSQGEIQVSKPVGTPGYMPPEQIAGHPQCSSDVFAVGMMGIQALTGYSPNQLPRNSETQEVEWHDQAPKVSPELVAILDKMVRYDPKQRYQTAAEVLHDLPAPPAPKIVVPVLLDFVEEKPKPREYKLLIEPQFEFAREFSEDLAAVVLNGKLGYINSSGKFSIPPNLEFDLITIYREGAYQFSEGLARLAVSHRWGYIDKTGDFVIPPKFDSAETFLEGLARVEIKHKYGYIDWAGNFLIQPHFESAAHFFSEELAGVEINHRYGYIDKTGAIAIPPQFDTADNFGEGLARITLNDKYGFIDKTGTIVIPAEFDVAHTFSEALARVRIDGKYGYIDQNGIVVIPPQFDDTFSFTEGLALVRNDNKYGFIDKFGAIVIPLQFDDAYPFSDGVAAVKIETVWGYLDRNGDFVVEPTFEDAASFHGGRAAVKKNGVWGYLGY